MTSHNELNHLEAKISRSAAQLLQTVLHAARARVPGTDLADQITNLQAARLEVVAVGSQLTIQVYTPDSQGGELLLIGWTAEEAQECH